MVNFKSITIQSDDFENILKNANRNPIGEKAVIELLKSAKMDHKPVFIIDPTSGEISFLPEHVIAKLLNDK